MEEIVNNKASLNSSEEVCVDSANNVAEIIELGEDTLEFISGARLMVCGTDKY